MMLRCQNNGAHVGSYKPNYETSYDSGEVLNRIKRWETAGALQLVEYRWLGAATLVNQILHPQISGGLVMNNGSKSSDYSAWDRYYRQAKVQWQKTNGSVNFEQRNYTYDRMGNRLTMDNSGSGGGGSNWDETYVYDGLNRLTTFKRGTISSGVISSPKFQQAWSLDSLGNWRGYDQTNNDTGLLPVATYPTFSQTRTNNAVNEITGGSFARMGRI